MGRGLTVKFTIGLEWKNWTTWIIFASGQTVLHMGICGNLGCNNRKHWSWIKPRGVAYKTEQQTLTEAVELNSKSYKQFY